MQPNPNLIWAIVPAAGIGQRMGADRPKQYLQLHETMVIDYTLRKLVENAQIRCILVGIQDEDRYWQKTSASAHPDIYRFRGGDARSDTVLNGLNCLIAEHGADAADWVLVHDAVRPCLRDADLEGLIAYCLDSGQGAVIGSAVVDTLKRVDGDNQVVCTEDRSALWRALTPQMFPLGLLKAALEKVAADNTDCTDEAQAMERAGHSVKILSGDPSNIKITQAGDLQLASFYIQHEN